MDYAHKGSNLSIKEHVSVLKTRRTHILSEIDQFEHEQPNDSSTRDKLYRLQREYNRLIDEEIDLTGPKLNDPLVALPPELWPNFLPEDTNEILKLTMVSSRWCHTLLSMPTLWTTVVFDDREADNLARAMVCLHLSKPASIKLCLNITLEYWNTVAPIVLPEHARIRSLSIRGDEGARPILRSLEECLAILSCFKELPTLQYLHLPFSAIRLLLGSNGFIPMDNVSHPITLTLLRRAPLLREAVDFIFRPPMLWDSAFGRLERVKISRLDESMVGILARLRNLKHLQVSEGEFDFQDATKQPVVNPLLSLPSITGLQYYGFSLIPALRFVGGSLTRLEATIDICDLQKLLVSIGGFQVLDKLALQACSSRQKRDSYRRETHVPTSSRVRILELEFLGTTGPLKVTTEEMQVKAAIEDEVCALAFRSMIIALPLAETVTMRGRLPVDSALMYLRSLHNLQSFTIATWSDSSFTQEPTIGWLPYLIPVDYLDAIHTHLLRHLNITNDTPRHLFQQSAEINFNERYTHARRYTISSRPLPSVLSLVLTIERHLLLDLHIFPNLRSVELLDIRGSSLTTWASDFFEELLLLPNQWPSLEHIGIKGDYIEWDILILMLERRNFVAEVGVQPIKSMGLSAGLPYKLLYPITQLLSCKFPERPPLWEFSIEEVGNRLSNPTISGCERCIRMFRPCQSFVCTQMDTNLNSKWGHNGDGRLSWEYELPHELLQPNPPLQFDAKEWLRGKRARRLRFLMTQMAPTQLGRTWRCRDQFSGTDTEILGGYSMDGARFEN